MKRILTQTLALIALVAFMGSLVAPAFAQEKPKALPFKGKVTAVDKEAKTITLSGEKAQVIHITAKTKIMKGEQTATLDDVTKGEQVSGSYREAGGKREAGSLYIGAKAPAADKKKKEKKEK
jgi:Cu/Ag efflux protein CusF